MRLRVDVNHSQQSDEAGDAALGIDLGLYLLVPLREPLESMRGRLLRLARLEHAHEQFGRPRLGDCRLHLGAGGIERITFGLRERRDRVGAGGAEAFRELGERLRRVHLRLVATFQQRNQAHDSAHVHQRLARCDELRQGGSCRGRCGLRGWVAPAEALGDPRHAIRIQELLLIFGTPQADVGERCERVRPGPPDFNRLAQPGDGPRLGDELGILLALSFLEIVDARLFG